MTFAPICLAHCIEATERQESTQMEAPADGGPTMAPPDGGPTMAPADGGTMKAPPDGPMIAPPDGGKTADDSGMKTQDDASSKGPADGATPTSDAGGPATPPDAGGPPHDPGSVPCNGAPCDVSHGYFCCVTWTGHGTTEACNPPHSACGGHTIECDEEADCDNGVCCQDFPSGGLAGSASCTDSCGAHICR